MSELKADDVIRVSQELRCGCRIIDDRRTDNWLCIWEPCAVHKIKCPTLREKAARCLAEGAIR